MKLLGLERAGLDATLLEYSTHKKRRGSEGKDWGWSVCLRNLDDSIDEATLKEFMAPRGKYTACLREISKNQTAGRLLTIAKFSPNHKGN